MLALPFTVTGMCTGNTESSEDVDCAKGDGSDAANTQNKGSGQAGTDAATCCEEPSAYVHNDDSHGCCSGTGAHDFHKICAKQIEGGR